jgi:hypothetical protein
LAFLTSYRSGFRVLHDPMAFVEGARELLRASWPVLLLSPIAAIAKRAGFLVYGSTAGAVLAARFRPLPGR